MSNKAIILLIIFFLSLFFQNAFSQISPPDKNFIEKISKADQRNNSKKIKGTKTNIGKEYDLKYHRFEWFIDPSVLYIKGSVTSYFVSTQANINQIQFELAFQMTVDSVRFHNSNINFSQDTNDILTINLGVSLALNSFDSVTVYYKGVPAQGSGFGAFLKDVHSGTPIIWTLSEPYGTKQWWPCKNDLSDKIDSIDVFVTAPLGNRVASNGLLISEVQLGANKVFHWKHRYPIAAYLIAIAVTNYAYYSDYVPMGNDSLEILNYIFPENLSIVQSLTPNIIPVMQLYNNLFIPYPFIDEKYGHAQFGWGGGMEHQTMSFMGSFSYEIMAHELAHQWFGDMISCKSWHDIWLNEAFATYLSGLAYEHLDSTFGYWEIWKNNKIAHITSKPGGSVYVYDTTSVSRVFDSRLSYSKAAMVLHMIRWTIGDSAFYNGIRNYLNDPLLAFAYAETNDLKTHFETSSGKNLTEFFEDWFYGEGYPTYTIQCNYMPNNEMEIIINQSQSHSSVSFFEMPVPLKFKGMNKDTIIVFNHIFSGQSFLINPGFKVDSIFFDPDRWIVSANDNVIMSVRERPIIRNLKISPNPVNDILYIDANNHKINKVELINSSGFIQNIFFTNTKFNSFEVDFNYCKKGVYFIKIYTEEGIITKKIVKI